ncbi:FHA domain-containing protein [Kitasatospora sp. NBC_01250]|uniref:FHA domain-containing protein n=1 Tax=unclassified Kitasatospora TaxID=2633591 RepID=UPI002E130B15|nr:MULTISPECIES: FHA domain-containing protein [unclassified Kitasatospora]WSJ67064.1 FHA domain-containing protein [Kitasatospora sp. NBC_01302]
MPICPRGHESQAEDWCDFCGFPMHPASGQVPGSVGMDPYQAPPPPPMPPGPPPGMHPGAPGMPGGYAGATEGLVTCPICRTPQTGRYCEECGYDYELAATAPPQHQGFGYQQPAAAPQGGYGYPQQGAPGYHPVPEQPGGYPPPPEQPGPPGYHPAPEHQGGYPPAPEQPHGLPGYPPPPEQPGPPGYPPAPEQPSRDPYGTSFHLAPPSAQVQPEPVRSTWVAVVSADRQYFTDMMARSGPEASGLFFPPYCPERRIPITGRGQLRIGRRSQHRGTVPEIDLSVPPEDPGASHQHALLAEQPDGSWVLVDQDSTNGTTLNGGADPLAPHTAIPLNEGDRIHIGAWTTITLLRA